MENRSTSSILTDEPTQTEMDAVRGRVSAKSNVLSHFPNLNNDIIKSGSGATGLDWVSTKAKEGMDKTDALNALFAGGTAAFLYEAANGRWKDILTDSDPALYEEAEARALTPDCANWLAQGYLGN